MKNQTVDQIFDRVNKEHDYSIFDVDEYDLANSFALDLAAAGYSAVSITHFIKDYTFVSYDDAIEISQRIAG